MKKVLVFLFLSIILFGASAKTYRPEDLAKPVFKGDLMVINPDNLISKVNVSQIINMREVYFFRRYIEPIFISVEKIDRNPNDFLTKCAQIWNLEKITNGKFIIQLRVWNDNKFYFLASSKIKKFYPQSFFDELNDKYDLTGSDNGSYDFVVAQKLGDKIFKEIAFDHKLDYKKSDEHTRYPKDIIATGGDKLVAKNYFDENSYNNISGYEGSGSDLNQTKNNVADRENLINSTIEKADTSTIEENTNQIEEIIDYSSIQMSKKQLIEKPADVPNQRTINNVWVSNPQDVISFDEVIQIDKKLKEIESSTQYEVAVVVFKKIDDANYDPYQFGLNLFNSWGIGKSTTNNGLLIMVLSEQRNLTFITGTGTELVLSDGMTYEIGENEMKPHFKTGNYATGILQGLDVIGEIFDGNKDLPYSMNESTNYDDYFVERKPFYQNEFFMSYVFITGVLLIIWFIIFLIGMLKTNLVSRFHTLRYLNLWVFPILFPLPFLILYFINRMVMNKARNKTRYSEKFGTIMHKLTEEEEDKFLTNGQIKEEQIRSINYDVWVTANHDDILVLQYRSLFSKYNKCKKCKYKTFYKEYDRTISSPSYTSSGTGEKKYSCKNCNHVQISHYTIPKLVKSTSSSSSGSSYSSSSSSSSGGSSYGGGRSSGGGSSSGW